MRNEIKIPINKKSLELPEISIIISLIIEKKKILDKIKMLK